MTTEESLWWSLALTVGLTAVHLVAPRINRLASRSADAAASFGGGLAVAYVFLHLLPELAAGNEAVGEALSHVINSTPLLDLAIFAVALFGFLGFYGLERLASRSGESRTATFRLHLASYVIYNALITYTMPLRLRTGVDFAILFAVAMALHFVLSDRGLARNYPHRFPGRGRALVALGLVAGWVAAAIAAPANVVLVSVLSALLGGSVLMNVFKEELPGHREARFPWFLGGATLYAVLLALVTWSSE